MARRFAYLLALGILSALGLLAAAPAASAHASVVSSSPADGAVVTRAPGRVTVTFDEAVGVSRNGIEVFAPNGDRVDTGGAGHGGLPQEITVALLPGLGDGTYTVGWHVISDDSHPVQGAFTFSIGAPSSTAVNPATLGHPASALVGIVFGVVRWAAFCSFALLMGAVAFVICCWPAGATSPAVLRLAMGAWGGLALSVLAAVLLQGVYGAGQGIGHVFFPNIVHATLYSRYGRAIGVRLALVIAALFLFTITLGGLPAGGRRARIAAGAAWGALTAALAATWAVADHSGIGAQLPLAIPADVIHLSAMAIWLGGLAMLVTIVLRRPRPSGHKTPKATARRRGEPATAEAAQAVSRFSPIALGCVIAIVVTGTYQAWRNVGTPGALTGTAYGRLLLAKIAGLCALIALGYLARHRVQSLRVPAEETRVLAACAGSAGPIKATVGARQGHSKTGTAMRNGHAAQRTRPLPDRTGPPTRTGAGQGRAAPHAGTRPGRAAPRTGTRPGRAGQRAGTGTGTGTGTDGSGTGIAAPDPARVGVTLRRLRWSVTAEAVIALAVLAITAILVNTPTARETFAPPARVTVAFDTGSRGGHGSIGVTVTPARLGPNQIQMLLIGSGGTPYRPQQIQAALSLPARHLGPLSVPLTPKEPGHYLGPVTFTGTGRWQLRITIRSDSFHEKTVAVPVSVH